MENCQTSVPNYSGKNACKHTGLNPVITATLCAIYFMNSTAMPRFTPFFHCHRNFSHNGSSKKYTPTTKLFHQSNDTNPKMHYKPQRAAAAPFSIQKLRPATKSFRKNPSGHAIRTALFFLSVCQSARLHPLHVRIIARNHQMCARINSVIVQMVQITDFLNIRLHPAMLRRNVLCGNAP